MAGAPGRRLRTHHARVKGERVDQLGSEADPAGVRATRHRHGAGPAARAARGALLRLGRRRWHGGAVAPCRTVRARQAKSCGPTKAVNLLRKKVNRVGHGFRNFVTTGCAATALRRNVADSPHREAARLLPTFRGVEPVYEAASKVWDVALTALQVQDEEQRVTVTKDLNRELSEFVKRARADLGV